jgi:magnesium chelatase family protein
VLFLDELPEFNAKVLEVLRQPMEDRQVTISRATATLTFPANFMLVAAMNPCPCGNFGDPAKECNCNLGTVARYQRRISGPLMDRIDIHIEVPRVDYDKLTDDRLGEPSEAVRQRVERARAVQRERFAAYQARNASTAVTCNGDMTAAEVRDFCSLDAASRNLVRAAMQQLQLSARAFHRILKLARTIADLDGSPSLASLHLAEAIQYRPRRLL